MIRALSPNEALSRPAVRAIAAGQALLVLIAWQASAGGLIPKPTEVLAALGPLWNEQGLGYELIVSLLVNLRALAYATAISLALSYLTVIPAARPIVGLVSKLRFLGLVGLTFVFTLIVATGAELKASLLTFGMTVFYVTSMADVVRTIPREEFDHARTLRMGEWRTVLEVVVLGRLAAAIEVLRQNAAIGWMMLTMVEGLVRSEGGIGALLLNQNKHLHLAAVFAIQLVILAVGVLQDYSLGVLRGIICPYASLTLERR